MCPAQPALDLRDRIPSFMLRKAAPQHGVFLIDLEEDYGD